MVPLVSVIMAVFNQENYVKHAIESILSQTYDNFEFLIVDDGSTDGTTAICDKYAHKVSRIRIFHNKSNLGLTRSLNIGLRSARGKYIARMDADDVSLAERLETQVTYLESHPEIGLAGSYYSEIDSNGNIIKETVEFPVAPIIINWHLCFENPIPHPPIMVRKELLDKLGGYNENYSFSQDYELFTRLSIHTKMTNIPEVLFHWRVHENSVSRSKKNEQRETAYLISRKHLSEILNEDVSEKQIHLIWNRNFRIAEDAVTAVAILLKCYRKTLELAIWTSDEKRLHRKYVSTKFFYYLRPFLNRRTTWRGFLHLLNVDPLFVLRLLVNRFFSRIA